jgi:hypothetical protein
MKKALRLRAAVLSLALLVFTSVASAQGDDVFFTIHPTMLKP